MTDPSFFEALFEGSPNAYMVLDRELRFVAANAAYSTLTATRREDLVGRRLFELFPHDPTDPNNENATILRRSLERVLETGEREELPAIVYRVPEHTAAGVRVTERVWSATHAPIRDAAGRVTHVLQHTVDITELTARRTQADDRVPVQADLLRRAREVAETNHLLHGERLHMRRLFEQAPGFVCFMRGRDHVHELGNPAFHEILGHRDIAGRSVREAVPELAGQGFFELLDRVYESGEAFTGRGMPVQLQRPHGVEEHFVDFVFQPIFDAGTVVGIFVSGNDVTAERKARRDRERLGTIVEQSTDVVVGFYRDGRIGYVNSAGRALLGLGATLDGHFVDPADERRIDTLFRDESLAGAALWPALERDGRWEGDVELRHVGTGATILVHQKVEAIFDPDTRELRGYASVSRDLRERQAFLVREAHAREAALLAADEHRFLADFLPTQVWTAKPNGELNYVNRRTVDYFGTSSEELLSGGQLELIHADDRAEVERRWRHSVSTGAPYEVEFRLLRAWDRTHRWHVARALPLRDASGAITKWFGANTDIDDAKRELRERERLIGALESRNHELDRFAFVASHDLKAPLRGIANITQWIADDLGENASATTRENLVLLESRVVSMQKLIDGILRYARSLDGGTDREELAVATIVEEVVVLLAPPEGTEVAILRPMPSLVTSRIALSQVLMNLVGNAIKHAAAAGGRIEVRAHEEGELVRVEVSDNGPGIAPSHHARIWELFHTVGQMPVASTGIGLSIVRRIVESQGGSVGVRSSEGQGATFWFTWPREPLRSSSLPEPPTR